MCKVENADQKPVEQICTELGRGSQSLRNSTGSVSRGQFVDKDLKKRGVSLRLMPTLYSPCRK